MTASEIRPEPPPQLIDGMTTLLDLGTAPPSEIGRIFTYVDVPTATWTEHWVVQPAGWFIDPNRNSRLRYANPQPNPQPWPTIAPTYSGWWHAAMTFTYQPPPASPPTLPVGTLVFDLRNTTGAGVLKGRLFRSPIGTSIRDRWVLFSNYVKPQGSTIAELRPKAGNPQVLLANTLSLGGPTAEYVDVTYTVTLL